MKDMMRAVILDKVTKSEDVNLTMVKIPEVKSGWVLVRVKAFGLNHSEQILRNEEILESYIDKPIIPGIECVGEIVDPSDCGFEVGQKVIALMGGMGRSFNGSYSEYALLPAHHVFAVSCGLDWEQLAAIPETYFTAWGSLFECLQLQKRDKLLIRGATCALGYAAIQLAKALGCKVIATTHRQSKMSFIQGAAGGDEAVARNVADEAVLDTGEISDVLKDRGITKVLDLVGPKTLIDTMKCVEKGGIVCNTGILGGVYTLDDFDPIKDIPNGVYLTGFFSNYPSKKIISDMFRFINENGLVPVVGRVFDFDNIKEALIAQDNGSINGKIVVKITHQET